MSLETNTTYSLSFTASSLRPELLRIVAENYLSVGDWNVARQNVLATNALQASNPKSAVRMESELRQRLVTLTNEQLELLANGTAEDRVAMAWLAACKHIVFVCNFAVQVLREKLASRDAVLRPSDYETFVNAEAISHPKLLSLSALSKSKIRQVLFRMLKEAGIVTQVGGLTTVQRPVLSPEVQRVIRDDSPQWFAVFLVPDSESR